MQWIETPESSNVKRFKYDAGKRELVIEFGSGGVYRYSEVPFEVFDGMKDAESKGRFFHRVIRGVYAFGKIG